MKCLVSGGLGFIGSNLVDLLIEEGHQVTILDDLSTGKLANYNEKAELVIGDIKDIQIFNDLEPVEYVFHLAALARIQPSIEDPVTAHATNLTGTLNVLEFCKKVGAKIIFSGSSSIYAGTELPTQEESELDPKNPYALQKLQCEQYIQLYGELYDLDYTILRYFNVYGEHQILDGAYAAVVGIFLDQKQRGVPLTITNDGEQRRDMTYVKDVARANVLAMNWPRSIFNIGTGKNYSMNELADFVGGEKAYIGERRGEARETLANNSRALAHGWNYTVDIKDWITKCVQ